MIDLTTEFSRAQTPDLGVAATITNVGAASASLDSPLGEKIRELVGMGMSCATLTRECAGTEPGVLFLVFNGDAMKVFGPGLLGICFRRMKQEPSLSGKFAATEATTLAQMFAWIDTVPVRCANGWLQVRLDGRPYRLHLFGFTGPAALEATATLENLGCNLSHS